MMLWSMARWHQIGRKIWRFSAEKPSISAAKAICGVAKISSIEPKSKKIISSRKRAKKKKMKMK